jgi:hypothetical protein
MTRSFFRLAFGAIALSSALASVPALAGSGGPVGAPGPIAGAGLPIIAVGYGAYWLVNRFRRKTD